MRKGSRLGCCVNELCCRTVVSGAPHLAQDLAVLGLLPAVWEQLHHRRTLQWHVLRLGLHWCVLVHWLRLLLMATPLLRLNVKLNRSISTHR